MNSARKEIIMFLTVSLITVFWGIGIVCADEKIAKKRYPIPDAGVLELTVPASWKAKIHKPQENMPPTIMFSPAAGSDFQVTMMILRGGKEEPGFNAQQNVKALLEKEGQELLSKALETKIVLQEIKGASSVGYYFSVTDKNPEPGEYRYMTRAGIGVGNLFLHVTVLHRVKESGVVKNVLSMLREARQVAK